MLPLPTAHLGVNPPSAHRQAALLAPMAPSPLAAHQPASPVLWANTTMAALGTHPASTAQQALGRKQSGLRPRAHVRRAQMATFRRLGPPHVNHALPANSTMAAVVMCSVSPVLPAQRRQQLPHSQQAPVRRAQRDTLHPRVPKPVSLVLPVSTMMAVLGMPHA